MLFRSDENVWLSQKMMGLLYDVESHTVTYHLQKAFKSGELDENSVTRIFRVTASDGKPYDTKHFNLKAIIAVGNKVDSPRWTEIPPLDKFSGLFIQTLRITTFYIKKKLMSVHFSRNRTKKTKETSK